MGLTNIKMTDEEQAEIIRKLMEDEPLPVSPIPADFSLISFESKSQMGNDNKKLLFTYDKSLERIKAAGHERHALPSEAFSFLIANLENKLTAGQKAIAIDMLDSWGEWLGMAWKRKLDKVICYSNPENLKWDGSKYAIDGKKLICSSENEFPLAQNIPDSNWVDLSTFDAGLVQFLYSRQFAQLPKEMRDGDKKAQMYLPPENTLWPLGRGFDYYSANCYCNGRVSRWVAVRKKIP